MNNMLYLTIFLGVMTAMAPLSTDMYLPSLPEIASDFHISTSMTQATLTMTMVGMAVGQVLGGPVSDRLGRKVPLLIGMMGFTMASLGCAWTEEIHLFLAFRFLQGLSGAFGIVIARAVARDVVEGPALMQFMALLMMVNGLAPIAAPVAGAQVLRFTDWHGIFIFLVGIGLVQMGLTMHFKETLKKGERVRSFTEGFAAFAVLVRNRYFFGQCLLQCFYFGAFFSYIAGIRLSFSEYLWRLAADVQLYLRRHRSRSHADGRASGEDGRGGRGDHLSQGIARGAFRDVALFPCGHCTWCADRLHAPCAFLYHHPALAHGGVVDLALAVPLRKECGERVGAFGLFQYDPGRHADAAHGGRRRPLRTPDGDHHGSLLCSLARRFPSDDLAGA